MSNTKTVRLLFKNGDNITLPIKCFNSIIISDINREYILHDQYRPGFIESLNFAMLELNHLTNEVGVSLETKDGTAIKDSVSKLKQLSSRYDLSGILFKSYQDEENYLNINWNDNNVEYNDNQNNELEPNSLTMLISNKT